MTSPAARSGTRILNEVRLARQITHPAVCRVFDVGEAEDRVFYSMELVQGEDLATLLRRVGRLPSEKVLDIGRQLCDGLAAAHAHGVLHRDLKPANVLIDEDGSVRITDFGFAIARDDTGDRTPIGTPEYMAPEQLGRAAAFRTETDLYALGAGPVRAARRRAGRSTATSSGSGQPPRPSTLVPDVDPRLERVILQALAPDPRDRPASAAAMADEPAGGPSRRSRRSRYGRGSPGPRWRRWSGMLAVLSPLFLPRGARALTDQDTIVLADFTNTTGEPVFDGTLKVALAVALEQSPFLEGVLPTTACARRCG